MLKNRLIRKQGLIAKFMTSQAGQQIIAIHILANILLLLLLHFSGINHDLNLFSETNYKKQTHILFSYYHTLTLPTFKIYCNLI